MALRPSKITSELIHTCNKFFSSNTADVSLSSKIPLALGAQREQPSYRYKISNTQKPDGLPDLNFKEEPTTLFAELQPSANPEFRSDYQPKWTEKVVNNSPFPSTINSKARDHVTYTDQQKAEDKMLKYKMACFTPVSRNYSMVSRRYYSKGPAENSGSANCKQKTKKCVKLKDKRECRVNKDCPKLKLCDCEQSKGSDCKLNYLDPNCTKKFAPYPSYSETCAENLPDDPSECHQCPWRTCDGADTIEPGKPVRNKRNYSTSCIRHLDATAGVVVGPLLPPPVSEVQDYICKDQCGKKPKTKRPCGNYKQPCKEPPGPCEVRRQKEEQERREKEIHVPPRPKKASEDQHRMVLTSVVPEGGQDMLLNPYTLESVRLNLDQPYLENKSSWIDINEGEGMYLDKKQKHPNCHKKKKPKRPDEGNMDQDLSIEYGNTDWWTGRGKKPVVIGNRHPSDLHDCKIEKCRDMTIRNKQSIIGSGMLLSKKKGKKIKGDEGHPPPCEDKGGESLNCPRKPIKKPKYKKRPMTRPYYKQPEDPYNRSNGK